MEDFHIIIPARYASTRLPGKPLLDIAGKSLIQRVVECAQQSEAKSVTVATDHNEILREVRRLGGNALLTRTDHESGSDRIAEAAAKLGLQDKDIIVNVQGDEPEMPVELINQVAQLLVEKAQAVMATAYAYIDDWQQISDSSVVKVVTDHQGYALYFSRAAIPFRRDVQQNSIEGSLFNEQGAFYCRHLGIYAYRAGYIKQFANRPVCHLEEIEKLEQLRVLWHGEKIACCKAIKAPGPGVDTEADLVEARAFFQ